MDSFNRLEIRAMVGKRKNFSLSLTPVQQEIINNFVRAEKRSALLLGLIIGFILNTVLAVTLVSVQSEIDYRNSQMGIDDVVKAKIAEINTKLETMEQFSHVPASGEEAKEMNEQR